VVVAAMACLFSLASMISVTTMACGAGGAFMIVMLHRSLPIVHLLD